MRVRGLLVDINGTLTEGDALIPGAAEAMRLIACAGLPYRYTTNIDSRPRREVAGWLRSLGLDVNEGDLFTPAAAASLELRGRRCHALVAPSLAEDLAGVDLTGDEPENPPEAVLVGDVRERFTYANLDRAFRFLAAGAELYALQKNRYRRTPEGPSLDTGAFVAALEYASGKRATVFGKPERPFFRLALRDLGLPAGDVAVVGDDPETDFAGAGAAGLVAVGVKTGKYVPGEVEPDVLLQSVRELPHALGL
ncbi:putative sugar phosphatases of the HAD superfamily [Rubrobacter radiotolerans]|uniref:HAD hydrolase-like protein n=1 Tax=Rubrobacter radiotolerans TaxID=42256 RepID=A0A023X1W8_RUBRA|nr:HAD hydrolase-like protein [Rubrobacter radiotolerans]AHY46462.1 putative sugar phosphatases of the HAD superfamily [Rubrobacter radiotolerans]MDX5893869.1 HAD hydrolase-like protein [Rubrobacter radiotolerans]SMC04659.1 HAD-superfamily subfamily IIA hydrolase, TIGR01458 [Rubrobacter radiotolerans DSM 5868]